MTRLAFILGIQSATYLAPIGFPQRSSESAETKPPEPFVTFLLFIDLDIIMAFLCFGTRLAGIRCRFS
ncbi:hypothetical protein BJX65DRAFT_35158 [Aspergillus insuetus]